MRSFLFFILFSIPIVAGAETSTFNATVLQLQADSTDFGGCMVKITPSPTTKLANCKENWVSMSCDGTYLSKTDAQRLYTAAQAALLTGTGVRVRINDAFQFNGLNPGYCLLERVDNTAP